MLSTLDNGQTDRQTNATKNITPFAKEVMNKIENTKVTSRIKHIDYTLLK